MKDAINPTHYKSHRSGIEAIEICQFLDFALGNAVKYCWRAGKKPGQLEFGPGGTIEDLRKSAWYLQRAIKLSSQGFEPRRSILIVPALSQVIDSEPVGSLLRDVLRFVAVPALNGDEPRIADALLRVENEIEKVTNA